VEGNLTLKHSIGKLAVGMILLISNVSAAIAHGALPLASNPIKLHVALNTHSGIAATNHIPGFSQSASNFYFETKNLAGASIAQGVLRVAQPLQGNVLSGQLYGTYYQTYTGGNSYTPYTTIFFPVQGSPTYASSPPTISSGANLSTQLNFSGSGVVVKSKSIGGIAVAPIYLPGSARTLQNYLNSVATAGLNLGEKMAVTSPIVGGEFYGTRYFSYAPPAYTQIGKFVYAFGNNPLNTQTGGPNITITNPSNYIQLANGKTFTYSSGLLNTLQYQGTGNAAHPYPFNLVDHSYLAIGNNYYNTLPFAYGSPYTIGNLQSYLRF
jgi:hypothetical protein